MDYSISSKNKVFRTDINFLRAIAVLLVVFYHFKFSFFSAGFIGVDVFFVISGFLMTKVISEGLSNQKFSFIGFYQARAVRIIPALAFLCLFLLFIGWFLLLPSEYRLLAKHSASSIAFFSNYIYLSEAGYFDLASYQKWLLHTWSLSVEWQFYIFYPLILILIHQIFKNIGIKILIPIFMFCLLYMIYLYEVSSKSLYFGLFGRIWELLAGSLVYLYPKELSKFR